MSGDVTNQEKKIATTNSGLNETNVGAVDRNVHPATKAVKPFQNYAKLAEATEHTSDKTLMCGGNVVRVGDAVGPPSYDPHDHTAGGVSSHTYLKEARATAGAPNVVAEGKAPTRMMDGTTQNHGNSKGIVFDPALADQLKKMAEEAKKRCSLKSDVIKCSHGREVGPTRILEVTSSGYEAEKVTYDVTRINAVEPGDPQCQYGDGVHTEWVIKRQKGGGLEEFKDEPKGVDHIELDDSWLTGDSPTTSLKTKSLNKREQVTWDPKTKTDVKSPSLADQQKAATTKEANSRAEDARGSEIKDRKKEIQRETDLTGKQARRQATQEWNETGKKEYAAGQEKSIKNKRALISGVTQLANQAYNLKQFLEVFWWRKNPVRINVQSQACSGSLNSEIVCFPGESVDFKFGQEEYKLVQAACASIKKFAEFGEKLFPGKGKVIIKLFEDPEIGVKTQWKELKRDCESHKKWQCNRATEVFLQIKTIFGVDIEIGCSLGRFIDTVAPGLGWLVEKIADVFGLEASVGIGLTIGVGMGLSFKMDEYDEIAKGGFVKLLLSFQVYIFVRVRFRDNLHVEGRVVGKWEPSFSGPYFSRDEICYAKLDKGELKLGFVGMFYASVLWWEKNESGEWWPECMKLKYNEQPIYFLRPVLALVK